ncbi:Serine/threonine protein kinase [Singulisphaera sp. GP187]|uniref:serine/threonine-protein kinase n=1 Tax=Singulisphaera sp. GP187 TaxID=1882752 RepID=UPI00092A57DD|nr:serine/threonine-protein kinase [Singulisphaera sp. GP187]SIO34912.1 Serine/threonine protein kinase [Singulisphaera sp. GP187]
MPDHAHDQEFERRVLRFEQAWQLNDICEIADFLITPFAIHDSDRLLVELICIDLEYRQQSVEASEPVTLTHYVEAFPELISLDRLPLELIAEEYRVRSRWGDRPSHAEFLSRFQERRESIRAELVRIDDELAAEGNPAPRPAPRIPPAWEEPEFLPEVPWLSHTEFLLRRLIGAGRMGKVYEARPANNAHGAVAVKFLRKGFLRHPQVVRRFLGEALTIGKLRHPNIVGTQGLGRTSGGSYFIVMDFVAGPNLAELGMRKAITVPEAVRWVMETCKAVEHAHAMGIVHCDLKPANLLLDESGKIKVTDFGLARSLTEDTPWTAEVEGTAPFMAPEQASRSWGPIDARTDVYGLGAVFFTLLTGRPPIIGRRLPDILAQVVAGTPVVAAIDLRPELPKSISDLCRTCLSKPPELRYQTVKDLHSALARLQDF